MRWWDNFLNRPGREQIAYGFIITCVALATGLMIGTVLRPVVHHRPDIPLSTIPSADPTGTGGVGARPPATTHPQPGARTTSYRKPWPPPPSRKPTHASTRRAKPTWHPPTTAPTHSPSPTEPTSSPSAPPTPSETPSAPSAPQVQIEASVQPSASD